VSDSVDDGVEFVCQARHCLVLICPVLHGMALHCNRLHVLSFWGAAFEWHWQDCSCGHGWNGIEYPMEAFCLLIVFSECRVAWHNHIRIQL
jgi:hypothetical protein